MSAVRLETLDSLRGLAALVVVAFHYTTRFQTAYGHPSPPILSMPYGYYGVQLFFAISGFVILMTLNRVKTGRDFLISRFTRLFPAFWVAVLMTYTVVGIFGLPEREVGVKDLWVNFTMLSGFLGMRMVDMVYWTLELELFFYLWMFLAYRLKLLPHIMWVMAVWLLIALAYVLSPRWFGIDLPYRLGLLLIAAHAPFFVLGVMAYQIWQRRHTAATTPQEQHLRANIRLSELGLFALGGLITFMQKPANAVVYLLVALLMLMFVYDCLRFLQTPLLRYFGAISYTLYLLHENIGWVVMRGVYAQGGGTLLAISMAFAVSVVLATLLTRLVEQPVMHYLRQRWR
ncbi:MAG: hypothetical protein RLZZ502_177 [Pseudomonadota bacterium]